MYVWARGRVSMRGREERGGVVRRYARVWCGVVWCGVVWCGVTDHLLVLVAFGHVDVDLVVSQSRLDDVSFRVDGRWRGG